MIVIMITATTTTLITKITKLNMIHFMALVPPYLHGFSTKVSQQLLANWECFRKNVAAYSNVFFKVPLNK